jgi:hypothetical protein
MRRYPFAAFGLVALFISTSAPAAPKIDQTTLSPQGTWVGYAISRHGLHVAVLDAKGSRFVMSVDGVAGPRIDQMISLDGTPYGLGARNNAPASVMQLPVLFSDDGTHSAYFAMVGDQYVLIIDGKQQYTGKYNFSVLSNSNLTFTTGGKHVYFTTNDPSSGYSVIVDGTPGPSPRMAPTVVSSPDGVHYAYVGDNSSDNKWMCLDGKQVPYFGDHLQYTPSGQLIGVQSENGKATLNVDGKATLQALSISTIWVSPRGGHIAALEVPNSSSHMTLEVDGQLIPDTQGVVITNVFFSPDDNHWAALCNAGLQQFVILDDKKGASYQQINSGASPATPGVEARAWAAGILPGSQIQLESNPPAYPGFTPDSSKFIYTAQQGGRWFLVSNEDESDAVPNMFAPLVSADGKHVAYITGQGMMGHPASYVLDGKTIILNGPAAAPSGGPASLGFSPDGSHLVYNTGGILYLDGAQQPDIACPGLYLFSPDSQHLLATGFSISHPNGSDMYLDGKFVEGLVVSNVSHPAFTPDSKHVFWVGHRPPSSSTDQDTGVLYIDGKPADFNFEDLDLSQPGNWQISAGGTLTFMARTGQNLTEFQITPGDDTSLATVTAGSK